MTGIYKITNTVNGKCYIGQSINIENRWKQHIAIMNLPNSNAYNYPLYKAFRKYGIDNFKFEVLEECGNGKLNEREIHWISVNDSCKNGYNQTHGGDSFVVEENYCSKCGKKLDHATEYCLECYVNSVLSLVTYCDSRMVADYLGKRAFYINRKIKNLSYTFKDLFIKSEYENEFGVKSNFYYLNRQGLMILAGVFKRNKNANKLMEMLLETQHKFDNIDFDEVLKDIE